VVIVTGFSRPDLVTVIVEKVVGVPLTQVAEVTSPVVEKT
jgi:hypothetical protein